MSDANADQAQARGASDAGEVGPKSHEDFLYHLYRGSEMLMDDRVVEAKEELERALSLQPQDAKSQDLLAGVYFRLGIYPRAIETWTRLVEAYPKNPTLRVNLGLAYFKTNQVEQSLEQLHAALRVQPDHGRAWGYLGLVHWKRGAVSEARDAFLRGGQAAMARRMEEVLAASGAGERGAPTEAASKTAVEEAIQKFEAEGLSVEHPAPERAAETSLRAPATDGTPPPPVRAAEAPPVGADVPPTLAALVERWSAPLDGATQLRVDPSGDLFVLGGDDVLVRLDNLVAVRGELKSTRVPRRTRGKDLEESLGGDNPIFRWEAGAAGVIKAPDSGAYHVITLEKHDLLYVKESLLWAFEQSVAYESGRLPLGGKSTEVLTQLHGSGVVVLRLERPPKALMVEEGKEVRVVPSSLVGWTGRLFPGAPRGTAPYSASAPPLAFRGEGAVLLS